MCNCNKSSSAPKTSQSKIAEKSAPINYSSNVNSKRKKARATITPTTQSKFKDLAQELLENFSSETLADQCQTFAYVLGLENPVPENVLIAAMENEQYAQRLFMNRNEPYLYELLNNPPERLTGNNSKSFSSTALVAKAGKALLKWGLSGFQTVSNQTLQTREEACLACPNLVESTNTLQKISATYKITNQIGNRTGNKACSLCGCVVKNKIRLSTETCPEAAPQMPGMNRWMEPIPFTS